jgi:DNA modification methylase
MKILNDYGVLIDGVVTSPPYNMTKRKGGWADKGYRYDVYRDDKSYEEYLKWTIKVFNLYDKILKENGVILYNFSYSVENPSFPYILISEIIQKTSFNIADTIIWKKNNSMPFPSSPNRLQRIWEFIFVIVRKNEIKTFKTNKQISKISKKGQKYYKPVDNIVFAKNNDGKNELNQAIFSIELVDQLINTYFKKGDTILDNFGGIGTTIVSCKKNGMNSIYIELSEEQTKYTEKRINEYGNIEELFK